MGRKQAQALLAALIAWPLAAQTYEPVLLAPQIIGSPQTMVPLNGGDDSTRQVQLGFPFEYYGQTFTSAWVSTNGFVSFQSPAHLCCNGLPLEQAQRNTIYAYWTDLISSGNPYYRTDGSSALFGWYNTFEYGTQNKNTFEINLSADGSIQINYGALGNTFHLVSAGITGPTAADTIQLFYGQNVQDIQNQSSLLRLAQLEPEVVPPAGVDPAPVVAPDPTQAASVEAAQEEPAPETVSDVAETETEAAAETAEESATTAEEAMVEEVQADTPVEEPLTPDALLALAAGNAPSEAEAPQAADAATADAAAIAPSEQQSQTLSDQAVVATEARRDRNVEFFKSEAVEEADLFARETVLQATLQNVAFLAQADAQYAQQYGEQTTTETVATTYSIGPVEGPTFTPVVTTVISDTSAPVNQSQQIELLGMNMQREMSVSDAQDVNGQDSETMAQLGAVPPGYTSYTQARVPDAPFYQPRDIYKGRRIPDANVALYRMMSGQNARWDEMVDDQYER